MSMLNIYVDIVDVDRDNRVGKARKESGETIFKHFTAAGISKKSHVH